MSVSVVPADLATYLNDDTINVVRAQQMIDDALILCSTIVSPLPDEAAVVVKRVAIRGYLQTSARQYQLGAADAAYGAQPGPVGGIYLMRADKADLRRLAGGGGAFSIDLLPAGYVAPVDPFDPTWGAFP